MIRKYLVALLAVAALGLALPALAGAATFTVNTFGDGGDTAPADGVCDSEAAAGEQCSLRAAVQSANATPALDEVKFGGSVTPLFPESEIVITKPLTISGCASTSATEPCVDVRAAMVNTHEGFVVRSSNVTIRGLALTGFITALLYEPGFTGLTVKNDWFGINRSGASVPNKYGMDLQGSGATVGGTEPGDRNVVGFNEVGIRVYGGDENKILGNYIGTKKDGTSAAVNTSQGVLVSSTPGDAAENNLIGGTLSAAAAGTTVCDGACNVISGNSSKGVNLRGFVAGESPSVGSVVKGNFIGLNVNGTAGIANGVGVDVTGVSGGVVGGPTAEERNYVTSGITGIQAGQEGAVAVAPAVRGNYVGLNSAGTAALLPPSTNGILASGSVDHPAQVVENRVVPGSAAVGINVSTGYVNVNGNFVGIGAGGQSLAGGATGIRVAGGQATPRHEMEVRGNSVSNSTTAGITLEGGQAVTVVANEIKGSAKKGGIYVKNGTRTSAGNVIGGSPADANLIENTSTAAGEPNAGILVEGDLQDGNDVLGNRGSAKTLFLDLAPQVGPGNDIATGPNAGMQPPEVIAAGVSSARGFGTPGAVVRVFRSSSPAGQVPLGVTGLLGSATVDNAGDWKVNFNTTLTAGAVVAALQSNSGNASELGAGVAVDTSGPPAPDITGGPTSTTKESRPTFTFSGEANATFECWIDSGAAVACNAGSFTPPAALPDGVHTFNVIQTNEFGNSGPAAIREFVVDTTPPAPPSITGGPSGLTRQLRPTFTFTGEFGATFSCAIDAATPVPCSGSFTPAADLAQGAHTFRVTQTDTVGNVGAAATRAFEVDTVAPAPPQISLGPSGPTRDVWPLFEYSGEDGASFRCAFDSDAFVPCTARTFTPSSALGEGAHTFRVFQIDAVGNEGPQATRSFTVDLTVPAAPQITAGPSGPTNQARPSFAFSGESGASFDCAIDGGVLLPCDSGTFTPAAALGDGPHTFRVAQTDQAENTGPEATREFTVDATAPAAPQITSGPSGSTTERKPTFAFNGEAGGGFSCAIDSATPVACDGGTFTPASDLAAGAHTFRVTQADALGNVSAPATRAFTVSVPQTEEPPPGPGGPGPGPGPGPTQPARDTTPPDTAIKGPKKLRKPTGKFVLSASEAGSSFQCKLDRKPYKACAASLKVKKLKPGKHVLSVKAVDAAGNPDPTPAKKVFKVGS